MNNILIFSDLHINQSSLKECAKILDEIIMLSAKYNVDTVISLGDTFDSLEPSSSELDLLSAFIKKLNKRIILLAADSHESTTQKESIVNHFGILNNMVTVVKEFKDGNHLYCGHFFIKESSKNYGAKLSKEDLKNYVYVFLGHSHSYEVIKPNICHLGSSRYVNFDEAKDQQKIIALIEGYDSEAEKVHFLRLKSPISMVQLELSKISPKEAPGKTIVDKNAGESKSTTEPIKSISKGESATNSSQITLFCQKLDKLDKNTKVKVKIMDFESFRAFLPFVNKYASKFETFKYETSFEVVSVNTQKCKDTETKSFKESFTSWLSQQNVDPKIKEILEKEIG